MEILQNHKGNFEQKNKKKKKSLNWTARRGDESLSEYVMEPLNNDYMVVGNGDNDDDDDETDDAEESRVMDQLMITGVIKRKRIGSSGGRTAREGDHRELDDYEVLRAYLIGDEVAQLGSFARAARGEVQNMPSHICPNTLHVNECRFIHILTHVIFVQEHIPTYAHVAMWLKRSIIRS